MMLTYSTFVSFASSSDIFRLQSWELYCWKYLFMKKFAAVRLFCLLQRLCHFAFWSGVSSFVTWTWGWNGNGKRWKKTCNICSKPKLSSALSRWVFFFFFFLPRAWEVYNPRRFASKIGSSCLHQREKSNGEFVNFDLSEKTQRIISSLSSLKSFRRKLKKKNESNAEVYPLLPPEPPQEEEEGEDFENFFSVSSAIAEAESFSDGSVVSIEEDSILKKDCVHLEGDHGILYCQLIFSCLSHLNHKPHLYLSISISYSQFNICRK